MNPVFLILHGSFATPDSNWFMMLKERLERINQTVLLPAFPVDQYDQMQPKSDTNENLESWLTVAKGVLQPYLDRSFVIVGHSLGPLFALHLIEQLNLKVDCLIAVSPFLSLSDKKVPWQFQAVNRTFYKTDFNQKNLKGLIQTAYVLYSDNDPYVPSENGRAFAKLIDASEIPVKGAAHMNAEVNLREFPLVLELCKSRVELNLYQKYIDHRAELFQEDTAKYHTEKIVEVSPKDIFDEGIFKFRNLQKNGFCTFPSNTRLWDNQSLYMQESRKAAARLKTVVRVFIIEDSVDLLRQELQDQIKADLESMQVFVVMATELPDDIARDFGIWDDEYVCLVETRNTKVEPKIMLSSRTADMERAQEWRRLIMEKAQRVTSLDEVQKLAAGETETGEQ